MGNMPRYFELMSLATGDSFTEDAYVRANPDVAEAISRSHFSSGREHFELFGKNEHRLQQNDLRDEFWDIKNSKLARIDQVVDKSMAHSTNEGYIDFLSEELRREFSIVEVDAVSAHSYDRDVLDVIFRAKDGLVLDCGAGSRPVYYENVVNYEIVPYVSTDVVGVAELLPFLPNSFDAVLSLQVLEHVKDPFACAREMLRVLKPGGTLVVAVPFLQPLHAYPHHYYNMTSNGVLNLFETHLQSRRQFVMTAGLPIFSLTWILRSWADGLPPKARATFSEMRVQDLLGDPSEYLDSDFVRLLPDEKNFELAAGTMLIGKKALV